MPSLEDQIINNRFYNRLINFIKSNNANSGGQPLNPSMSNLNSINPIATQLDAMDRLNQLVVKSKRFESGGLNYEDLIKNYLLIKRGNDLVNKNSRKPFGADDYLESSY